MNSKYLGIIIGVSALLNAFLGGLTLSHILPREHIPFAKGPPSPPAMEDMMLNMIENHAKNLSETGRSTVDEIVRNSRENIHPSPENDPRSLFEEIHAAMMAEDFDKTKIEKLHKTINTAELKQKEAIGAMMVKIASSLSKEDRILFFKNLFPSPPPKDHQGKENHPDEPYHHERPQEGFPDE